MLSLQAVVKGLFKLQNFRLVTASQQLILIDHSPEKSKLFEPFVPAILWGSLCFR